MRVMYSVLTATLMTAAAPIAAFAQTAPANPASANAPATTTAPATAPGAATPGAATPAPGAAPAGTVQLGPDGKIMLAEGTEVFDTQGGRVGTLTRVDKGPDGQPTNVVLKTDKSEVMIPATSLARTEKNALIAMTAAQIDAAAAAASAPAGGAATGGGAPAGTAPGAADTNATTAAPGNPS